MKILLYGVETINKGSELMLYSILREIEKRHPYATVYLEADRVNTFCRYLKTSLRIKRINVLYWIINKLHINSILKKIHVPQIRKRFHIVKGCDYFFNAIGFHFSDQFHLSDSQVQMWDEVLEAYKSQGTKIIFLPQAYGPIEYPNTKKVIKTISDTADIVYSREKVSYKYLNDSNLVDMTKVKIQTDFTSPIKGLVSEKYEHLKNEICIIPNMKMIDKGIVSFDDYSSLISEIKSAVTKHGKKVFFLCHEGKRDELLAKECSKKQDESIEVVTGLNALEVKGVISQSYVVISSRFHGVASALNSCVPCLATSWSHKYEELFKDYKQPNCILPINDKKTSISMVQQFMEPNNNNRIREELFEISNYIQEETEKMWNEIWAL